MGTYLNPGNNGFAQIRDDNYVDKTGLLSFLNETLNKPRRKFTCVSRPRRFGKTMAAKMICAYYDKSCSSRALFEGLEISGDVSFEEHLNRYNVIYLDITWFISQIRQLNQIVDVIQEWVIQELRIAYPGCIASDTVFLPKALSEIYNDTEERFLFVIDEWDALFRETKENTEIQKEYIQFLRGLFKGGIFTDNVIVGAYMTGILPIKKYGTESALTDFREFSMAAPGKLARFVGFTEKEVKTLCQQHGMDYETMRQWYDGYSFRQLEHIYSPNSVMAAIDYEAYGNYWTRSESFESLKNYITMDMDGLKSGIVRMLGGQRIKIDTLKFTNDLINLKVRDQVLTLLVHLGYLAYDEEEHEVYIPNLEVAEVFKSTVEESGWEDVAESLAQSEMLLTRTIEGDAAYVAAALERYHQKNTSILKYNDENSLACVLTIAYYTAQRDYTIVRELPSGKGFADLTFVPRRFSDKPAMIVELKHGQTAETALQQIRKKDYAGVLKDYVGKMLLVGISYDKEKGHACVIESYMIG